MSQPFDRCVKKLCRTKSLLEMWHLLIAAHCKYKILTTATQMGKPFQNQTTGWKKYVERMYHSCVLTVEGAKYSSHWTRHGFSSWYVFACIFPKILLNKLQSPVWPTAAKERLYRYLHTHSLYQITSLHDEDLVHLAKSFITAAGLPTIPQVYEEVANKCLSFLQSSTQLWQSQGLIILGDNNTLAKCPLFQKLWDYAIKQPLKRRLSIASTGQALNCSRDEVDSSGESLTSPHAKTSESKPPKKVIIFFVYLLNLSSLIYRGLSNHLNILQIANPQSDLESTVM